MSEYEDYYRNCEAGYWVNEDAVLCGCKGHGWFLSELDTFHKCYVHFSGQPHPNEEPMDDECLFTVTLKNIEWDTDGEEIPGLPSEATVRIYATNEDSALEFALDKLSDEYSWCIQGSESSFTRE